MTSQDELANFMIGFGSVASELHRLTGLTFFNTKVTSPKPIDRSLRLILECHNKGQYQTRDYMLAKVALLVKNLQEIEKYDKRLFEKCKKQLLRSQNDNEYYGARFEISVTSALIYHKINNNINFIKQDKPDFQVNLNGIIYLECTSAHIVSKNHDVYEKLIEIICNKGSKSYCNNKTALLIDVTNILCHHINEPSFTFDRFEGSLRQAVEQTNFGSLLYFFYYADEKIYTQRLFRIDSSKIDPLLTKILDILTPIDGEINPKWHPQEG